MLFAKPGGNADRMTEKGFYMWKIGKPHGKLALFLTLAVIVVIAFMCINIWPMWLKIAIWYVSFYALVFLVYHSN